jgi:TRAP-type mannitol/chloroaromatic compound transport system substrate-binding protein
MKRRHVVGGLAAAASLIACERRGTGGTTAGDPPAERFEWSAVTSWPPKYPGLGVAVNNLAERIEASSAGRLRIKVYAGGELVPPFEVFDAVSRGTAECGHGASYYHKGKVDAAQFFTAIPFGLTAQEMNGWLYYGGGLDLWRELYAPHRLVPFPCGNTGVQMGGWFNKAIDSVASLKGLKMRIPGLGGEVLRRAGGTPVTLPGSEIFTALKTGAIDATEWVGPYNDLAFGLHKAARYYYYPGWQEPGPILEFIVNEDAWEALPPDLKAIVETSAQAINLDVAAEYTNGNANALRQLMDDPNVELRRLPDDVIAYLKSISEEVIRDLVERDPAAARIFASFDAFRRISTPNQRISEQAFLETRAEGRSSVIRDQSP